MTQELYWYLIPALDTQNLREFTNKDSETYGSVVIKHGPRVLLTNGKKGINHVYETWYSQYTRMEIAGNWKVKDLVTVSDCLGVIAPNGQKESSNGAHLHFAIKASDNKSVISPHYVDFDIPLIWRVNASYTDLVVYQPMLMMCPTDNVSVRAEDRIVPGHQALQTCRILALALLINQLPGYSDIVHILLHTVRKTKV